MATGYKQPIGQKRLTNIAVVRMKKHGQRFEVACFKNKVMSWRAGIEKDIDEVLQVHTIFANVGKGTLAKSADLMKAFGTDDEEVVCRKILAEGEYQVSDKERDAVSSSLFRDVLSLVMERTVNPDTLRPYSLGMIEKFAHELHFSVDPLKSSKQQALDLIRQLVGRFPIARAKMELRLTMNSLVDLEKDNAITQQMDTWQASICSRLHSAGGTTSLVFRVDPSVYRQCDAWAQANSAHLEVLATAVQADNDLAFDQLEDGVENLRINSQGAVATELSSHGAHGAALQTDLDPGRPALRGVPIGAQSQSRGLGLGDAEQRVGAKGQGVGVKCTTCACGVESREAYREHCKSEWHKHNMRRKARSLPPLSREDCAVDLELGAGKRDGDEF